MRSRYKEWLQLAAGFTLLAALALGLFAFVRVSWSAFVGLDKQVAAALLTAFTTVTVAVVTVVVGKQIEHRRAIDQQNREKKVEVYELFMKEWFEQLTASKRGKSAIRNRRGDLTDDFLNFIVEFSRKAILWGGKDVIAEYKRFRSMGGLEPPDALIMVQFERVLLAMRKDVGLSNKGLETGALLGLFITDADNAINAAAAGLLRQSEESGAKGPSDGA